MKEKDIYLIRHGQTALNAGRRILGQLDIGLTDEGVEEVRRLALHLKEQRVQPQMIYTSPLLRALRTAELLQSDLGGFIEEDEALREIDYGLYEGADRQGLRDIEYGYSFLKMQEGQGETAEEVERRILPFLNSVLLAEEDSVLVVTHAFSASVMAQIMMRIPITYQNIQPLATADYSHFKVERGGENTVYVLSIQRHCLKGALSI